MNAQWTAQFIIKGPVKTYPTARGITFIRDGDGFRGSCYFSSADLATPAKAHRRARDTLKTRLVRAGIPARSIAIFDIRCVG